MIVSIHDTFAERQANNTLKSINNKMPLVLLSPDKNGASALDIAREKQRPISFETMLEFFTHGGFD